MYVLLCFSNTDICKNNGGTSYGKKSNSLKKCQNILNFAININIDLCNILKQASGNRNS